MKPINQIQIAFIYTAWDPSLPTYICREPGGQRDGNNTNFLIYMLIELKKIKI